MTNILSKIPIANELGAQQFTIELDGNVYNFHFRYNYRMSLWIMDIHDEEDDALLTGIPLVTGVNLLHQYVAEELPTGHLIVVNETDDTAPDRYTMGKEAFIYYLEVE